MKYKNIGKCLLLVVTIILCIASSNGEMIVIQNRVPEPTSNVESWYGYYMLDDFLRYSAGAETMQTKLKCSLLLKRK